MKNYVKNRSSITLIDFISKGLAFCMFYITFVEIKLSYHDFNIELVQSLYFYKHLSLSAVQHCALIILMTNEMPTKNLKVSNIIVSEKNTLCY